LPSPASPTTATTCGLESSRWKAASSWASSVSRPTSGVRPRAAAIVIGVADALSPSTS
jgi:hypothetical protein